MLHVMVFIFFYCSVSNNVELIYLLTYTLNINDSVKLFVKMVLIVLSN